MPTGCAVDAAGYVYVAEWFNSDVRRVSTAYPYPVETSAGSTTGGAADGPGSTASFGGPHFIAVDPAGNLYVADTGNNTIRLIQRSVP